MEQQSVSIAKGGVVCTLPARTAVMAAANPSGGHYNKTKTVSENLKLNPALLSRFDLVFILLDQPNPEMDGLLSEHIMRLHAVSAKRSGPSGASSSSGTSFTSAEDEPLHLRLQRKATETVIPLSLISTVHSAFRIRLERVKFRQCDSILLLML